MYTNERRRVAQFCHIRRRQNRDKRLITNAPRSEIPAQITKILLALVIIPYHEPPKT